MIIEESDIVQIRSFLFGIGTLAEMKLVQGLLDKFKPENIGHDISLSNEEQFLLMETLQIRDEQRSIELRVLPLVEKILSMQVMN